jgi:sec-independent protein translocase protein TatA
MAPMFSGAVSPIHWLLLIVVLIVLFGAKRLPDVARGLGKSARILKAEVNGLHEDDEKRSKPSQAEPEQAEAKQLEAKPATKPAAEPASTPASETTQAD